VVMAWIAAETGVKPVTVRSWISRGIIPPVGDRVPSKELMAWIERRKVNMIRETQHAGHNASL